MSVNSIRNLIDIANKLAPNKVAIKDKNNSLTFSEVYTQVNLIA